MLHNILRRQRHENGFTLIELLVVVIIIAILAAIAVPVYIGIQNNAKKSSIQSDVATTKLNVAAAFAEDQPYSANLILKSGSPKNESVIVYGSDGSTPLVNGDKPQEFIVVGTDGNDLGGYTVTYKSSDATQTQKTGTVSAGGASDGLHNTYLADKDGTKHNFVMLTDKECSQSYCSPSEGGKDQYVGFDGTYLSPLTICYKDTRSTALSCTTSGTVGQSATYINNYNKASTWVSVPSVNYFGGVFCVGDYFNDPGKACHVNLPTTDPLYGTPRAGIDTGKVA